MSRGLLVPPPKKTQQTPEELAPEDRQEMVDIAEEGPFKARIAMRQEFKDQLDVVAEYFGSSPGAVVEARLRRFVTAFYPAALQKRQDKLKEEQERLNAELRKAQNRSGS